MFSQALSSTLFALAVSSSLVSAAPIRRQSGPNPTDVLVLQFAQVLNQLEQQFYQQALTKFQATDITGAGFTSAQLVVEQLTTIQNDESSHIQALQGTLTSLGQTPVTSCTFDFSSVLTDVPTTVTVARLVENVGVGAFIGAAHLVSDPSILTAAASIVTVEGRHQTLLNIFNNGAAIANPFDLALNPNEVLAIAGPFIQGCDLGVQANPSLTITNAAGMNAGTQMSFSSSAITGSMDGMFCQILAGGLASSISMPASNCVLPDTLSGPIAVWITSDDQPLNNNARDRTNATTVAGPAMMFVDNKPEAISALVRASNQNSTIVSTVTPDQASSIIAGASVAGATAAPGPPPEVTPTVSSVALSDLTTAASAPTPVAGSLAGAGAPPAPVAEVTPVISMVPAAMVSSMVAAMSAPTPAR